MTLAKRGLRTSWKGCLLSVIVLVIVLSSRVASQPITRPREFKLAVIQSLTGVAAPHDEAAVNAAQLLVERINREGGLRGTPITLIIRNEDGPVDAKVAEFRQLVLDEKVSAVVGITSSSKCLAVAPVAEELRTLYVSAICANHRLSEERKYRYVFRTASHAAMENVAAARYVLRVKPDLKTVAGINYDYAYGRDSWEVFVATLKKLKPDVRVVGEIWVRFLETEYTAPITQLLAMGADVVHTVNWGAGLTAFIEQATVRRLIGGRSLVVMTTGLMDQARRLPPGVLFSGRGYYLQHPDPRRYRANREFIEAYRAKFGKLPDYTGYYMAQAILGLKAAVERAVDRKRGQWPSTEEVVQAFEDLRFDTPRGPVWVRPDHEAEHEAVWGFTSGRMDREFGFPVLERLIVFKPGEVFPRLGRRTMDWIREELK
jgi:branched-chain amino acid transport system substrate-binding protein